MTDENRSGVYELSQNPTLSELIEKAIRKYLLAIRTHTIAIVDAYYADTQKVDVTVQMLEVVKDYASSTSDNPNPVHSLPAIKLKNIPVAWPRTSSAYITFPLSAGDSGELHVQDRDISQWLSLGSPSDPIMSFLHSLNGAIFHPNVFSDSDPIASPDNSAAVIECSSIKIGASATKAAARVDDTVAAGTSMANWISAINTAVSTMGAAFNVTGPLTGAPGTVVLPVSPMDFGVIDSGSSKVKVE